MVTTIQIDETLKDKLDKLKIHHRETYNELLKRMLSLCSPQNYDKESLVETIEILSSPETMRNLANGIEDFNKEKFKTLEQIKKELKI